MSEAIGLEEIHAAIECQLAVQAGGWWDLSHGVCKTRADRLKRSLSREYVALVNCVMAGEQLKARSLIGHDSQLSRVELAERASREAAKQQAEGMPHWMNSEKGLLSLRAALGKC